MKKKQIIAGVIASAYCTVSMLSSELSQTDLFQELAASAYSVPYSIDVNMSDYGDVNEDGNVNVFDISYIQEYMNGTRTLSARERIYADLNADEEIDEDDIAIIKDIYLGYDVSNFKNAWYKKYSSNTYGPLKFKYHYDTISITGCDNSATSVTIPQKINGMMVSDIDMHAFYNCTKLTSIEILDGVTSIESAAFSGCTSLKSVTMSDTITYVGTAAFKDCTSLKTVRLSANIEDIAQEAFCRCTSLTHVNLPNTLKYIGHQAFDECPLDELIIPESVTSIGYYESAGKTGKVWVLNKDCTIGRDAFYSQTIIYGYQNSTAETYALENGNQFVSLTTKTYAGIEYALYSDHAEVVSCSSNANTINIMSSVDGVPVTKIADQGLASGNFQDIILPSSITSIGELAFWNCSNLVSIKLPDSVTTIDESAFVNCGSLKFIDFSANLKEIGMCAFWLCDSLESVTIPESVERIGNRAFLNCNSLSEITILNSNCELEVYNESESLAIIPQWTIVYGYNNSTAKNYADKYGRAFISLDAVTGDVDDDDNVSISDATCVLTYYAMSAAGLKPDSDIQFANIMNGDVDNDGKITISDATAILSYYAMSAAGLNPTWNSVLNN